jgi:hypothetical protein
MVPDAGGRTRGVAVDRLTDEDQRMQWPELSTRLFEFGF